MSLQYAARTVDDTGNSLLCNHFHFCIGAEQGIIGLTSSDHFVAVNGSPGNRMSFIDFPVIEILVTGQLISRPIFGNINLFEYLVDFQSIACCISSPGNT